MFGLFTVGFLTLLDVALAQTTRAVPQTINLMSRSVSARRDVLNRRALNAATVPLTDFFRGTDLQWFGNMSIGTPPQEITVVFDTGSTTLEFVGTACGQACANQTMFDPSKSSTFVDFETTATIEFTTGVGVDPVSENHRYALTLRAGQDTVSVGGLQAPNVSLNIITNQTATFLVDPFSGIQGMGAQASGFFSSLVDQGLPAIFSLFLTPNSVGNAELTIGGLDSTKFQGNLTYASLPADAGDIWSLPSTQLSVNGQTTSLLKQNRSIIFDSGTSNVLFSTDTAEAIYALISPDIKANPDEPGSYGIACDQISSLPAIIDLTFTSQTGEPFNLTIPSSELSVGPFANNASMCQTLINAFDGVELVGGSVLKHYYSVWDIGAQRIGFAPINSTQSQTSSQSSPTTVASSAMPLVDSFISRIFKYSIPFCIYLITI